MKLHSKLIFNIEPIFFSSIFVAICSCCMFIYPFLNTRVQDFIIDSGTGGAISYASLGILCGVSLLIPLIILLATISYHSYAWMRIDYRTNRLRAYTLLFFRHEDMDISCIADIGFFSTKESGKMLYISNVPIDKELKKKVLKVNEKIELDKVAYMMYKPQLEKYLKNVAEEYGINFNYLTPPRKRSTPNKPAAIYPASAYRDRKATALKLKGNVLLKVLVFSVPGLLFIGAGLYAQLRLDKSGNFMYITGVVINLAIFILCRNNVFANWYYDDIGIFTVGLLGYGKVINAIEWKDVKEIGCYTYLCKTYIKDFYISDHVIDDDDIDSEIYSKDLIKLEIANGEEVKHASPYDRLEEDFLKKIKSHVNLKWKNRKSRDVK